MKKLEMVKKTKGIKAEDKTTTELRAAYPESLIKAFVAVKKSDWADKEYKKYAKEVEKFLGEKSKDAIESGRLVVLLSNATTDLI